MSVAPGQMLYSLADYLALEEESLIRHEYLDGAIYAMAEDSPDHAALAAAILRLVGSRLPRGCRAFTSDLRIRIEATGLSTYPDAAVVCGRTQRASDDPLAIVNPTLLVEVTSRSTDECDRSAKLQHYQSLPSVREILTVSHREPWLTLHQRGPGAAWSVPQTRAGGALTLACTGAELRVDDVYAGGLEDV